MVLEHAARQQDEEDQDKVRIVACGKPFAHRPERAVDHLPSERALLGLQLELFGAA
jgi:hypothetical protein